MNSWLNRIEGFCNRCEFPSFAEFMLIDKFVSALNDDEVEMIKQSDLRRHKCSYKQFKECILNCNNAKPENRSSIESNEKLIENDETLSTADQPNDKMMDLNIVKPEPVCVILFWFYATD